MKNVLLILLLPFLAITLAFSLVSCNKEKENSNISDQLQQSWNVTSIKTNYHNALGDSMNVYNGAHNDTFQFKTDGKVISIINGDTTIAHYTIISNSRLLIDNEYYSINKLTTNSLILYFLQRSHPIYL